MAGPWCRERDDGRPLTRLALVEVVKCGGGAPGPAIVFGVWPRGDGDGGTELPVLDLVYLLGSVVLFVVFGGVGKVLARL